MNKYIRYGLVFFGLSFIGFIFESILLGYPAYEQMLYYLFGLRVPFVPMYGIGGLLMIKLSDFIDFNIWINGIINGVAISVFELTTGYVSYFILGYPLWTYSHHFWNLGQFTSIPVILFWIICGIGFEFIENRLG